MLQDTGQLVPVEAEVNAGAAPACSPFSPHAYTTILCPSQPQGVQDGAWLPARKRDNPCCPHSAPGLGLGPSTPIPPIPASPGHGVLASAR